MHDDPVISDETAARPRLGGIGGGIKAVNHWRLALRGMVFLLVVALLYYPAGMIYIHEIDDTADLGITVEDGASLSVAVAAALIERETDTNRWTANDPFFLPGALLDNMPNFQRGIIYALSRFAIEMSDQIGRIRGSSQVDADLDNAAGRLKYPSDIWVFDFATSLAPTTTSEAQYRAARRAFLSYNKRLAAGEAKFERRADNLQATLERIGADLGSQSAGIDHAIAGSGWLIDFEADDVFYLTKGRLYGYYQLLAAFRVDFRRIIDERELGPAWEQMLASMRHAAQMDPLFVVNGAPDGQMLPSHLAAQGFYLLRARTQLKEIANILLK